MVEHNPALSVLILEKTTRLLSKVKVSGGGRCNVTHRCFEAKKLASHYPRGERPLRELFKAYQASHVVAWFENKGVKLKAEEDGRMFPTTDDSQTIVDLFLGEARRRRIQIETGRGVNKVEKTEPGFIVVCEDRFTVSARKVLIAAGGHPQARAYEWIKNLGHTIKPPIPSLFTFNDSQKSFTDLMGIAVPNAHVKITGTKFSQSGPVLITHWGLSGPAVIKLSAWAAEYLHERQYAFTALVSWIGDQKEEALRELLMAHKQEHGKQRISSHALFELPHRLWSKLCSISEIEETKTWGELAMKNLNKLIENLIRCPFQIKGKTTFKEEFVTCGGVPLTEVDVLTMESKLVPNLFFAGEVLDIDGETGGFNFQAAWTTAYLAAKEIAKK